MKKTMHLNKFLCIVSIQKDFPRRWIYFFPDPDDKPGNNYTLKQNEAVCSR